MKGMKTYKFKLIPTKSQEQQFIRIIGTTRFMYNFSLSYKNLLYKEYGISLKENDLKKEITGLREDYDWIKEVGSQTLQDVVERLYKSFDNFFRRVKNGETPGYPKFAKKDKWKSFIFKQSVSICENTNKVKLPKIGKVKFRKSQEIFGNIKRATIIKEVDGWYICFLCETEKKFLPKNDNIIAMDLGIKELIVTSEKEHIENPKTLFKYEKLLKKKQKQLSKKKLGSNNRLKIKKQLQKIHLKIKRIREDNLHKVTTKMINENQVIICEDLNITKMMQNPNFAKSISDSSWGKLISMLEYKAISNGRYLIKVPPQFTSQDCNKCKYRNSDLKITDRNWTCPNCNTLHQRDENATDNIKEVGLKIMQEAGHVFFTFGDMVRVISPAEEQSVISAVKGFDSLQESNEL
jgi:putative transposase